MSDELITLAVDFDDEENTLRVVNASDPQTTVALMARDVVDEETWALVAHSPLAHRYAHLFAASLKLLDFVQRMAAGEAERLGPKHRDEARDLAALARGEL